MRPERKSSSLEQARLAKPILEILLRVGTIIGRGIGLVCGGLLAPLLFQVQIGFSQSVTFDNAIFKGNKNAPITLIEFADYQCPFCARFSRETFPQIEQNYVATGKVKFVFLNFPLEHSHPYAFKAAEAAQCASEQGKFWEMHRRLFDFQDTRYFNDWPHHAQMLSLDSAKFMQCLDSEATASKIRNELANGKSAGVKVTPTFFIGFTEPNQSQIKPLRQIVGAQPYTAFKEVFDSLLRTQR
jgi:protein-disulfide isomerase